MLEDPTINVGDLAIILNCQANIHLACAKKVRKTCIGLLVEVSQDKRSCWAHVFFCRPRALPPRRTA